MSTAGRGHAVPWVPLLAALLAGPAVAQEAVPLQPRFEVGRVFHDAATHDNLHGTVPVIDPEMRMHMRSVNEVTAVEGNVVHLWDTLRTENPFPALWILWPNLIVERSVVLGPSPADYQHQMERNDFLPLVGRQLLSEEAEAHVPTLQERAFGACGPANYVAVLPEEPSSVGDSWDVEGLACTFESLDGETAQVRCAGQRVIEDPWAALNHDLVRSYVIDTSIGLVTDCELTGKYHRVVGTDGSLVQNWTEIETVKGTLGEPDRAGWMPGPIAAPALVVAAPFLAIIAWFLSTVVRRRRS